MYVNIYICMYIYMCVYIYICCYIAHLYRARPPLAPGSRANGSQGGGFGSLGDALRVGGGASAIQHYLNRALIA